MEQMREEGAKLLCKRLSGCSGFCHAQRCVEAIENYGDAMDAALSLMQPEIDRRVAEEKVKLLERLRTPSEGMIEAVAELQLAAFLAGRGSTRNPKIICPTMDMFRSMARSAFQQENSDDR